MKDMENKESRKNREFILESIFIILKLELLLQREKDLSTVSK